MNDIFSDSEKKLFGKQLASFTEGYGLIYEDKTLKSVSCFRFLLEKFKAYLSLGEDKTAKVPEKVLLFIHKYQNAIENLNNQSLETKLIIKLAQQAGIIPYGEIRNPEQAVRLIAIRAFLFAHAKINEKPKSQKKITEFDTRVQPSPPNRNAPDIPTPDAAINIFKSISEKSNQEDERNQQDESSAHEEIPVAEPESLIQPESSTIATIVLPTSSEDIKNDEDESNDNTTEDKQEQTATFSDSEQNENFGGNISREDSQNLNNFDALDTSTLHDVKDEKPIEDIVANSADNESLPAEKEMSPIHEINEDIFALKKSDKDAWSLPSLIYGMALVTFMGITGYLLHSEGAFNVNWYTKKPAPQQPTPPDPTSYSKLIPTFASTHVRGGHTPDTFTLVNPSFNMQTPNTKIPIPTPPIPIMTPTPALFNHKISFIPAPPQSPQPRVSLKSNEASDPIKTNDPVVIVTIQPIGAISDKPYHSESPKSGIDNSTKPPEMTSSSSNDDFQDLGLVPDVTISQEKEGSRIPQNPISTNTESSTLNTPIFDKQQNEIDDPQESEQQINVAEATSSMGIRALLGGVAASVFAAIYFCGKSKESKIETLKTEKPLNVKMNDLFSVRKTKANLGQILEEASSLLYQSLKKRIQVDVSLDQIIYNEKSHINEFILKFLKFNSKQLPKPIIDAVVKFIFYDYKVLSTKDEIKNLLKSCLEKNENQILGEINYLKGKVKESYAKEFEIQLKEKNGEQEHPENKYLKQAFIDLFEMNTAGIVNDKIQQGQDFAFAFAQHALKNEGIVSQLTFLSKCSKVAAFNFMRNIVTDLDVQLELKEIDLVTEEWISLKTFRNKDKGLKSKSAAEFEQIEKIFEMRNDDINPDFIADSSLNEDYPSIKLLKQIKTEPDLKLDTKEIKKLADSWKQLRIDNSTDLKTVSFFDVISFLIKNNKFFAFNFINEIMADSNIKLIKEEIEVLNTEWRIIFAYRDIDENLKTISMSEYESLEEKIFEINKENLIDDRTLIEKIKQRFSIDKTDINEEEIIIFTIIKLDCFFRAYKRTEFNLITLDELNDEVCSTVLGFLNLHRGKNPSKELIGKFTCCIHDSFRANSIKIKNLLNLYLTETNEEDIIKYIYEINDEVLDFWADSFQMAVERALIVDPSIIKHLKNTYKKLFVRQDRLHPGPALAADFLQSILNLSKDHYNDNFSNMIHLLRNIDIEIALNFFKEVVTDPNVKLSKSEIEILYRHWILINLHPYNSFELDTQVNEKLFQLNNNEMPDIKSLIETMKEIYRTWGHFRNEEELIDFTCALLLHSFEEFDYLGTQFSICKSTIIINELHSHCLSKFKQSNINIVSDFISCLIDLHRIKYKFNDETCVETFLFNFLKNSESDVLEQINQFKTQFVINYLKQFGKEFEAKKEMLSESWKEFPIKREMLSESWNGFSIKSDNIPNELSNNLIKIENNIKNVFDLTTNLHTAEKKLNQLESVLENKIYFNHTDKDQLSFFHSVIQGILDSKNDHLFQAFVSHQELKKTIEDFDSKTIDLKENYLFSSPLMKTVVLKSYNSSIKTNRNLTGYIDEIEIRTTHINEFLALIEKRSKELDHTEFDKWLNDNFESINKKIETIRNLMEANDKNFNDLDLQDSECISASKIIENNKKDLVQAFGFNAYFVSYHQLLSSYRSALSEFYNTKSRNDGKNDKLLNEIIYFKERLINEVVCLEKTACDCLGKVVWNRDHINGLIDRGKTKKGLKIHFGDLESIEPEEDKFSQQCVALEKRLDTLRKNFNVSLSNNFDRIKKTKELLLKKMEELKLFKNKLTFCKAVHRKNFDVIYSGIDSLNRRIELNSYLENKLKKDLQKIFRNLESLKIIKKETNEELKNRFLLLKKMQIKSDLLQKKVDRYVDRINHYIEQAGKLMVPADELLIIVQDSLKNFLNPAVPVGLPNSDSACYRNASHQALFNFQPIRELLLRDLVQDSEETDHHFTIRKNIQQALVNLFKSLSTNPNVEVIKKAENELKEAVFYSEIDKVDFISGKIDEQHDAALYINLILNMVLGYECYGEITKEEISNSDNKDRGIYFALVQSCIPIAFTKDKEFKLQELLNEVSGK